MASSISKRTTLGTIEIGGIQSGKETQSLSIEEREMIGIMLAQGDIVKIKILEKLNYYVD